MSILFFDCFSGISGDMTVGALCDLGVKPSTLEWELSKLDLGDFHMHFDRQKRGEIEGIKFSIHTGATHTEECCDHGHAHEHKGHSHEHGEHCGHEHHDKDCCHHEQGHEHEGHSHEHGEHCHDEHHDKGCCDHEHGHEHEGHSHEHGEHCHDEHRDKGCCHHEHGHSHAPERKYTHIRAMIEGSELSPFVKEHALSIFHRIAVAEAKIHGTTPEEVHFHEVGALDSIADVVCACVGIETLGIKNVYASELQEGHGWLQCDHGQFPIPAPATLEILSGIPLRQTDETHELITPTGAAIIAEFSRQFGLMPPMKTTKVGYGVGTRELASRPNVLRVVLGELAE